MRSFKIALLAMFMILPVSTSAQVFGTFTTAAISGEGEGGAFVLVGEDAFRTGAYARFELTERTDLGIQLGFDRNSGENSLGGGADFKLYLINAESKIPLDIALDAALGHLRSDGYSRNLFGISLIVSGVLQASTSLSFEPYGSLTLRSTYFSRKVNVEYAGPENWPKSDDDWSSITDTIGRCGVKIYFSNEYQLLAELEINDGVVFGAAVNVVF